MAALDIFNSEVSTSEAFDSREVLFVRGRPTLHKPQSSMMCDGGWPQLGVSVTMVGEPFAALHNESLHHDAPGHGRPTPPLCNSRPLDSHAVDDKNACNNVTVDSVGSVQHGGPQYAALQFDFDHPCVSRGIEVMSPNRRSVSSVWVMCIHMCVDV